MSRARRPSRKRTRQTLKRRPRSRWLRQMHNQLRPSPPRRPPHPTSHSCKKSQPAQCSRRQRSRRRQRKRPRSFSCWARRRAARPGVCVAASLGIYWFTRPRNGSLMTRVKRTTGDKKNPPSRSTTNPKFDHDASTRTPANRSSQMPEDVISASGLTAYLRVTSPTGQSGKAAVFAVQPGIVVTNAYVSAAPAHSPAPAFVQVTVNSGEKNESSSTARHRRRSPERPRHRAIGESPYYRRPLPGNRSPPDRNAKSTSSASYGKQLGSNITISESSISSLRKNEYGDLAEIQVNGGMNPGTWRSARQLARQRRRRRRSVIRGTSSTSPSRGNSSVMDGRLWETSMGEPYLRQRDALPASGVDPLRIREFASMSSPRPGQPPRRQSVAATLFGDGSRQTHTVTYRTASVPSSAALSYPRARSIWYNQYSPRKRECVGNRPPRCPARSIRERKSAMSL